MPSRKEQTSCLLNHAFYAQRYLKGRLIASSSEEHHIQVSPWCFSNPSDSSRRSAGIRLSALHRKSVSSATVEIVEERLGRTGDAYTAGSCVDSASERRRGAIPGEASTMAPWSDTDSCRQQLAISTRRHGEVPVERAKEINNAQKFDSGKHCTGKLHQIPLDQGQVAFACRVFQITQG